MRELTSLLTLWGQLRQQMCQKRLTSTLCIIDAFPPGQTRHAREQILLSGGKLNPSSIAVSETRSRPAGRPA
ncbi:hypothetical protein AWB65_05172 [Caballeronia humi]|uniref:Uncharacterized protein n=1 Tax=Caballeronia humi TaxID=326474 RepID=A0A158IQH1_9BURK|nr:hypothetical protein AWB65_05172 [Caballeronia humi]